MTSAARTNGSASSSMTSLVAALDTAGVSVDVAVEVGGGGLLLGAARESYCKCLVTVIVQCLGTPFCCRHLTQFWKAFPSCFTGVSCSCSLCQRGCICLLCSAGVILSLMAQLILSLWNKLHNQTAMPVSTQTSSAFKHFLMVLLV